MSKRITMYLSSTAARLLDEELMSPQVGFSLHQLMELAGLSCASAITDAFPTASRFLVVCGPGNNGGDGLVCARHLSLFSRSATVLYPKRTDRDPFIGLVKQMDHFGIPFIETMPGHEQMNEQYDVVVDAIFGFSFKGDIRPPFADILREMCKLKIPVASIDVPSGWHVDDGPSHLASDLQLRPTMLISLTAPKECARHFSGLHYVGGRFVSRALRQQLGIDFPYKGPNQYVKLEEEKE
eukprot:ANDGO_02465.mRNA.1 NAD(P)H-hydrate epimerase